MRERKGASAQAGVPGPGDEGSGGDAGAVASGIADPGPPVKEKRGRGRPRSDQRRVHTSYDFSQETMEMLERAKLRTGSASAKETLRRALVFLDRHLDEVEAGSKAVYERPDGSRTEIVVL